MTHHETDHTPPKSAGEYASELRQRIASLEAQLAAEREKREWADLALKSMTEHHEAHTADLDAENARLRAALTAADNAFEVIHDEWAEPCASAEMGQIAAIAFRASMAIEEALRGDHD